MLCRSQRLRLGAGLALVVAAACGPPVEQAFHIRAVRDVIVADGHDRVALTILYPDPVEGVVVELSSSAGVLSSSTALLEEGAASVTLGADDEAALGKEGARRVVVRATVRFSESELETAEHALTMIPPTGGPPLLFLAADPPAADADGASEVRLVAVGRRLAPGTALSWTTTAGALTSEIDLLAEGEATAASAVLTAPAAPANAVVEVSAGEARASTVVRFVEPGTPQFDLHGTWVQYSPARVKLVAGTLVPNPQCVVAPSLIKMEVRQTDLDMSVTWTTCQLTFPSVTTIVGQVATEAPPGFIASVPVVEHGFTVPEPALGAEWRPPKSVVVGGAALDDPEGDPLPTEADDPRVVDSDGDGEPGVTVLNSLGNEQRVAYRTIGETSGRIRSSTEIRGDELGDLKAITETSVFGLGQSFLPDALSIDSVFQAVRIDGRYGAVDADSDGDDALSCDEVVAAAPALFDVEVPFTPFDCGGL